MDFFLILLEGLSLLLTVACINPYSLYNPYASNIANLSLRQRTVPTPLNPRLFFLTNGNNGLFQNFLQLPLVQACSSLLNTNNEGSCLNLVTCLVYGGKPSGFCQAGFKTCCLPTGSSSRLPVSTFLGSSSTLLPATFTITRTSSNFCQVRLNFNIFSVGSVDANGNCVGGLTITGHSSTSNLAFVLCGQHTGEQTVLNFNNGNPITLTIAASGQSTGSWNIRATQIRCSDQVITTTTTTTTTSTTTTTTTTTPTTPSPLPVSTFTGTASTPRPATFSLTRLDSSYCQVRLDFNTFDVSNVNQQGICDVGLVISGHSNTNGVPNVICGLNTGQHIYLNLNAGNPIVLTVNDIAQPLGSWNITETQIKCTDTAVPSDCLQYFNDSTMRVSSFNFRDDVNSVTNLQPTYMMSNLDYNVCLDSTNATEVLWTKGIGTTNYYFALSNIVSLFSSTDAGTIRAATFGTFCSIDYVEIQSGSFFDRDNNPTVASRFCGVGFPSTVTSTSKPFRLHVVTNGAEINGGTVYEGSVGFALTVILV